MADLKKTTIKATTGTGGKKRALINPSSAQAVICELFIQTAGKIYQPAVLEGITWETERKGTPGKLTFTVMQDDNLKYDYGSTIVFKYNGKNVFYGYLFKITPSDSDHTVKMMAYDQMRYLKNKHTYVYSKKRLDQLVRMIAADFNLQVGTLANTGHAMSRVEDNQTLFDIIGNATDETVLNNGKLYVLYDDFGKLTLKNISSQKLDTVIDKDTIESCEYTGSIDDNTYNKIVVYYDDEATRQHYIAQHGPNQTKWGTLQLTEKTSSKEGAKLKAKTMLDIYNAPTRSLQIKGAIGDTRVRAGTFVPVLLELPDVSISNYMLVEKAKHTFSESEYTMDLTLRGNTFQG